MNKAQLIDYVTRASETSYEVSESPVPVFLAVAGDGSCNVCMTPWRSEAEKVAVLERLRSLFRDQGVVRYAHVSEAWTRSFTPEEMRVRGDREVSSYDDREERLFMLVVDADEGTWAAYRMIDRGPDGRAVLGPVVELPSESFEGRLCSLLSPSSPRKETWKSEEKIIH